jgi:3-polyprenyl-4-hydroxybenzoate decarboxylase
MQFRDSGHTNIGCRRIMLRGPRTAGIDMIAPSDARAIFLEAVAKGEKTPAPMWSARRRAISWRRSA